MYKVGFIGLGIMGKPMVRNLMKAGFEVIGYNRTYSAVEEMAKEGMIPADNPRQVAEQSDVIITIVTASSDVEAVLEGPQGAFEAIRPGHIFIDMATISPMVERRLAAKAAQAGAGYLDAPVSGGDKGAIEGTLSIMVGGEPEIFEKCLPVFKAMGKTVVWVGPSGAGQTVKACNQLVVALNYLALSEALVLGSKAGVDPLKVLEVLGGGLANSRVLEVRGKKMAQHDFAPGGKVLLHHKDLGIIHDLARSLGVTLPASALAEQLYNALMQNGYAEYDHSSVMLLIEQLSNHRVGEKE
jgi:2-hydroxy-3-oxopropionate reductase